MLAAKKPGARHGWVNTHEKSRVDVLRNGRPVLIRHVAQLDSAREYTYVHCYAPSSRHALLLGQLRESSKSQACIALAHENGRLIETGASRYADTSEYQFERSVNVAAARKRLGLGTLLMEHLIEAVRENGVHLLYSVGASSDAHLCEMSKVLGFEATDDPFGSHRVLHHLYL